MSLDKIGWLWLRGVRSSPPGSWIPANDAQVGLPETHEQHGVEPSALLEPKATAAVSSRRVLLPNVHCRTIVHPILFGFGVQSIFHQH